ncbi:MAG: hypothetical protein QM535_16145, partial [Limnohabitans sp.]|nr:hypothetical protein [Limnohabitans sp.]
MKLFIQARKYGYKVLYPPQGSTPPEFYNFGGDIVPVTSDTNILGKYFYSIAFEYGGCIFTKYVFLQDAQRGYLGFISFSVFIPNNKKLSGNDVIALLDKLFNTYYQHYCPDYILGNITEDWEIFENIVKEFHLMDLEVDDIESLQSGSDKPAFVYYKDTIELCKFFNIPYQEEYSKYKQVFFVENNRDNPLGAIKDNYDPNANLTGKIDLENPVYALNINQQKNSGVKIEVKVKDIIKNNGDKIKKKDILEISWSKKYYKKLEIRDTWEGLGNNFVIIDNVKKSITVKEIDLKSITYKLEIETIDYKSNPINDAKIILTILNSNKLEYKNTITGEQLQNKCSIKAEKGNLSSPEHEINEEDLKTCCIKLMLSNLKVKFNVKDVNGKPVNNYKIQIKNKDNQPQNGTVEF